MIYISKGGMKCAAGEICDDLHKNLLERVKALHYPKGERSAPQAKYLMIYMKTIFLMIYMKTY